MRLNPLILILNLMLSITVAEVGAMQQKGEFLSEIVGKIIPTFFATAECSCRSQRGFDPQKDLEKEQIEIRKREEKARKEHERKMIQQAALNQRNANQLVRDKQY